MKGKSSKDLLAEKKMTRTNETRIEATPEEAAGHYSGMLSDEELDKVSGGKFSVFIKVKK